MACRAVPTLHLTVDGEMPVRLATHEDTAGSRLPPFRPHAITWNPPPCALNGKHPVFSNAKVLILGHGLGNVGKAFNRWVGNELSLPPTLERLIFGQFYDRPVHKVSWPGSLREINFGEGFNQPIQGVRWPGSLERLTFGECFNHPIDRVEWPASLEEIAFGMEFNQPVAAVTWPTSLQKLSFGDHFNQSVAGAVWPAGLRELAFGRAFQRFINGVEWPGSLERLTIARHPFNPLPSWPGVEVCRVWRYWWNDP